MNGMDGTNGGMGGMAIMHLATGDPAKEGTMQGPIADQVQFERVTGYIAKGMPVGPCSGSTPAA